MVDLGGQRAVMIHGGFQHTCAVLEGGALKCWGASDHGELGLGHRYFLGDEEDEMGDALASVDLGPGRRVEQFAPGSASHTCAVLDDDGLRCWGHGEHGGQLGRGNTDNIGDDAGEMGESLLPVDLGSGVKPVQASVSGRYVSCAVLDSGALKCWGHNFYAQLGLGDRQYRGDGENEMGDLLPAVALGSERTAKLVAAGASHTCAVLDDESLRCWGYGDLLIPNAPLGMRGDLPGDMGDNLPVTRLPPGLSVLALSVGGPYPCVLLNDGSVRCWGYQDPDSPESSGTDPKPIRLGTDRTVKQLVAGVAHYCALLDDHTVKCWGDNSYGQLGLGDTDARGDDAGEMGDALPAVSLSGG